MGPFDFLRGPNGGLRFYPYGQSGDTNNYWNYGGQNPQGAYGAGGLQPTTFHLPPVGAPSQIGIGDLNPVTPADPTFARQFMPSIGPIDNSGPGPDENAIGAMNNPDIGPTGMEGMRGPLGTHNPQAFDPAANPYGLGLDFLGMLANPPMGIAKMVARQVGRHLGLPSLKDIVGNMLGLDSLNAGFSPAEVAAMNNMTEQEAQNQAFGFDAPGEDTSPEGLAASFGFDPGEDVSGPSGTEGTDDSFGEAEGSSAFAKGGYVTRDKLSGPDPRGPDDGRAYLNAGEFVINAASAKRLGRPFLTRLNKF